MRFFNTIFKLIFALVICFLAFFFRTPFLANLRAWVLGLIVIVSLGLVISEVGGLVKKTSFSKKIGSSLIVAITSFGLFTALGLEFNFILTKQYVLNQDNNRLEQLGQHFIVGYRDFGEVKHLVAKKAIGGVFITKRNIKNKTSEEIQQEIKALQDIRHSQRLPPLWIATDQEGGIVSRLSPPLSQLPQLSKIIDAKKKLEENKDAVVHYAQTQGRELSQLGINLNFAPVVDLNKGIVTPDDRFSKIYQRAISTDKNVVAKVALWYCKTLERYGVNCTIKHFPGLGRINVDTHVAHAELSTSVDELSRDDWVPFREVMSDSQAFTMLGHAILTEVDANHPVSFSKSVITGIIRNAWNYEGIVITDDFSMQAVFGSNDGVKKATVKALNAGVDLILIAFDKDLYYEAMSALLNAEKTGNLDSEIFEKSRERFKQARKIFTRN
jgi:beta-N-acetylhexosaminidase